MAILAAIVGLALTILVHELGHFLVLRKRDLARFTIGIPVPGLTLHWERGGVEYRFSPLLLLGWVEPKDEFEEEPLAYQVWAHAAGGVANFSFALLIYFVLAVDAKGWGFVLWEGLTFLKTIPQFFAYLFSLLYGIFLWAPMVVGPVWIVRYLARELELGVSYFVVMIAVINVAVATAQLLPLLPLDGGKIILAIVQSVTGRRGRRMAQKVASRISILVIGAFFALVLWEVINLF